MKNLVHEIHRRSLWQVLGIYLAGSWVALQVVEQLTEAAGLPEWVRPFSLVLLVLGFPVVMATAFIQEGAAPRETGDSARTPVADRVHHRFFTWRNAVLGGVAAFALLAVLAGGYLALRALGIGPAGTLIARGALEEGARVVVSDFESPDPDLADVVTGALRIDLLQSPAIRVAEPAEVSEGLRRMARDPDTRVSAEVARELAAREGYTAVVEGEIGTAGAGYVLTARIVGGETWTALAGFRETARGEEDLIEAIERLSRDIRDKAGESLRSVQSSPPLGQVTTSSLEALRLYTRGDGLAGDWPAALDLFERASEIDPDFAMAHRKVAVILGNMGIRRSAQIAALERAWELRERLPEVERYLAEADYREIVRGDRDGAMRAFENLLEIDADNEAALNNLGLLYGQRGRTEEAEALFERAVAARPIDVGFSNLARARIALGRPDAGAALDRGVKALPDGAPDFEDVRVFAAASAGDYARADSLAAAFAARFDRPMDIARSANQRFALAVLRGRLRAAEARVADFDAAPGFLANPLVRAAIEGRLAALRGDRDGAVRSILETYALARDSLPAADRAYGFWLPVLIEVGGADDARRIYADWKRDTPEEELGTAGRDARREIEARLAEAEGRTEEAARLWAAYERECPGTCALTAALGLAGTYAAMGDAEKAAAEYERFLARPAWNRFRVDAHARGPVLERLGQLYDAEGDLENAAKYYAQFVDLWADADEELQPRVRAAQERLEQIVRERG